MTSILVPIRHEDILPHLRQGALDDTQEYLVPG